ncbi:hypothetical protein NP233_g3384 [Leucocoprinus birnbaumii]|uniref:Fork-head domain-containing protein n=1 Tax=Leucocoprinus birnbaumii TaxID=56174 RepID=A0AAD5YY03_9AGAR|nr:hypothetical protein NP233_g3384 [Leucocoprinus birnbaumii]
MQSVSDAGHTGGTPRPEPPTDGGSVEGSPLWLQTDSYLRNQIGIPQGTRVDLWALPDPPAGQRPQHPLPILMKLAIHGSERGMLTLEGIYEAIQDRYEFYANTESFSWKTSVKHNLALNQIFRSNDGPTAGEEELWSLDISEGEGYKHKRARRPRPSAPQDPNTQSEVPEDT